MLIEPEPVEGKVSETVAVATSEIEPEPVVTNLRADDPVPTRLIEPEPVEIQVPLYRMFG
jgi:hypothetical protein